MPPTPLRALALVAALATACSSSTAPLPTEGAPDELRVTYGGFGFGSHDVTLRNDTLVVVRRNDFRPESTTTATVVPDAAAWQRFWTAADAAGVARWPRRCANTNIVDGGGFSLRIVADARTWESQGSNSYPQANGRCSGEPEHSRDFQAFTAAVSQLIGRPFP
jgi:hypothetical protein